MHRNRRYRGLHELYSEDAERADRLLFGGAEDRVTRRWLLRSAGFAALGSVIGATLPLGSHLPAGLVPVALADSTAPFEIAGKDPGLIILNDRPLNAETPAHLLDDAVTPASRLFVRNNGLPPETVDADSWRLRVDGESALRSREFSLAELRKNFDHHTYALQLECGGNGRSDFYPAAKGNQWTTGAVGCAAWTGVRLGDVLKACGIRPDAVYIGYYGADRHLSGDPKKVVISRGVPLAKALGQETLLAWAMNGEPIPRLHGGPLRLVCGGWPASASGKWLTRIVVRDRVHDGPKMGGQSYRVPCFPVAPGEKVADDEMCIIESMPVKSLVTHPASGIVHSVAKPLAVRGHAWAGELRAAQVDVSIDFGQTWSGSRLEVPRNRLAWQQWSTQVRFPQPGYYEVWARATDERGRSQPMVVPGWNPRGYLNNACHRIAVRAV